MKVKGGKVTVAKAEIRVNVYDIVLEAVESGLMYGWVRAYKYSEAPGENAIRDEQCNAIMNNLCERIDFGPFDDGN